MVIIRHVRHGTTPANRTIVALMQDGALPSVSFVVPTFRRTDALARTLDALLAVDYPADRLEVIVVDDGDDDETEQLVSRRAGNGPTVGYLRQRQRGVAAARNRGAASARGELLIFCDDDIIVEPSHVRDHLAARAAHGDCLVNGHWEFEPTLLRELEASPFGRFRLWLEDWVKARIDKRPLEDGRTAPSAVTACNLGIARPLFERLGGFDEAFPHAGCEDQDLSLRAQAAGCGLVYDTSIRLLHNDHRVQLRQFCERQRRGALTMVYLAERHPHLADEHPMLLANAPPRHGEPAARRAKKHLKSALSTDAGLALARGVTVALERISPGSRLLHRAYWSTCGLYIFRGVREGYDAVGRRPTES